MVKKKFALINFILIVLCVLFINIISKQYFYRWDLTEDRRYTISNKSKEVLRKLDDVVFIEIFLDGDFPAGFKRLQRTIKETLDEFRIYAGSNLQYKFTNPSENKNEKERSVSYKQLSERGLQPTNIFNNEDGKQTENLIFPGAIISYKGKEAPILFLKGSSGASSSEILNQSVEGVEFELISAINKKVHSNPTRIGILEGHGELTNLEINDFYASLKENYIVDRLDLQKIKDVSSYFDILIIAKPTQYFTEEDKLKIDQFIVKGGKALFLINKVNFNEEKLGKKDENIATGFDLNLDDLLFRYGIRLNASFIKDLQSGALPMVVGLMGDKPQQQLMPWPYYPIHTVFGNHPSVKNMSAVMARYEGSIDTVKAANIKKTPLMFTSNYVKEVQAPMVIDLNEAKKAPEPKEYLHTPYVVGVLLEGRFKSLYTNRLPDEKSDSMGFKSQGEESKVIVFSSGDLIRNEIGADGRQVFPLGYDRYMRKNFANKDLIENCISFLANESGIINTRSKEIKLRPLDKLRIKKERTQWQMVNVVMPVLFLIGFGLVKFYNRRRRYAV